MSSTKGGGLPPRSNGSRSGRPAESAPARRSGGSSGGGRPTGKRKKSGAKRFWTMFWVLLVLLIVAAGVYFGWMYQKSQSIGTTGEPTKPANTQPLAMALLGTDFRSETGSHLTDVVMVAAMNPNTDTATIVSLPRDTRIELDGYKVRKVNAYYPAFLAQENQGEGEAKEAKEAMQRMLGKYFDIPIDYVTVVNFDSLRDIVDALGGIEVDVTMDMCYKDTADGTDINLKSGLQKLDGKNALDYVRYRKTNCNPPTAPSDDFSRNQRQQQVIGAIMDKLQSFNALTKSGSLIDAVADNTDTDLENKQILNLVKTYWDIPKENILFPKVSGTWNSPFVYINDGELSAAKQALKDELAGKHQAASTETGQ